MSRTILLLFLSNIFMTFAWYAHLRDLRDKPLWIAILASWGIAFFEYCLQVPANRAGYGTLNLAQLKITQEIITLVVFAVFAIWYLREPFHWKYLVSFALILGAVYFAFKK